jgi:hypothetical protein
MIRYKIQTAIPIGLMQTAIRLCKIWYSVNLKDLQSTKVFAHNYAANMTGNTDKLEHNKDYLSITDQGHNMPSYHPKYHNHYCIYRPQRQIFISDLENGYCRKAGYD